MKLQKEFFEIYSSKNNYNKNVIDLDEENFSEDKEDKNYLKMQSVDDEIKYINYLIKITEQNLLMRMIIMFLIIMEINFL